MDRKKFLLAGCGLCGAAGMLAYLEGCSKTDTNYTNQNFNFTLDLTNPVNAALNNVGGYAVSNGAIVYRSGTGSFSALSLTCTHQGCEVNYYSSSQEFICPCHGSVFGQTGNVITGPAPTALQKLNVTQNGNVLTIHS